MHLDGQHLLRNMQCLSLSVMQTSRKGLIPILAFGRQLMAQFLLVRSSENSTAVSDIVLCFCWYIYIINPKDTAITEAPNLFIVGMSTLEISVTQFTSAQFVLQCIAPGAVFIHALRTTAH